MLERCSLGMLGGLRLKGVLETTGTQRESVRYWISGAPREC